MLYDDDFIRNLPNAYHFENPWVIALVNYEHNKRLRTLIEKWYQDLPDQVKPHFYSRLRSTDDIDMIPALYELMAHRYCFEEGWRVEYEPALENGKTPDFVVATASGSKFVLEVASLFDSDQLRAALKRKREMTQRILQIDTDFILELKYMEYPREGARPAAAASAVKNWLKELPNDGEYNCSFGKAIAGCHFTVKASRALPRPSRGCVLSIVEPGGSLPDYSARLQDVLNKKSKKYSSKKTKLPLVVLVGDAIGFLRGGTTMIDQALFGRHQITFGLNSSDQPQAGRDRSGYFTPTGTGDGKWKGKNTGVSAVLFASLREEGQFLMEVFHNPYPVMSLDESVFYKMPQLLPSEYSDRLVMRWAVNNPDDFRVTFS